MRLLSLLWFCSFNNRNQPFENWEWLESVTISSGLFEMKQHFRVNKIGNFHVAAAAASVRCDLSNYFLRFFIGGRPLSNSDVDKLIDFETNLPKPILLLAAGRFIPFFFTVFESVMRSGFLLFDLMWVNGWKEVKKNTTWWKKRIENTTHTNAARQEIEISGHLPVVLLLKSMLWVKRSLITCRCRLIDSAAAALLAY